MCGCVQVPAEELEALRTGAVERLTLLNREHTYGYRCGLCPTKPSILFLGLGESVLQRLS